MRKLIFLIATLPAAPFVLAQQGLTTEWDIQKTLKDLAAHSRRMIPIVEEARPEEWIEKGAPETYVQQAKALKAEYEYAARAADEVAARPDSLGKGIELYLRLNASDTMLNSLLKGIRNYQNPALADLIEGVSLEGDTARGRYRDYLIELANTKETEFKIADQEAQRCRNMIIKQPAPRPERKK
jgi:hypothetical protein